MANQNTAAKIFEEENATQSNELTILEAKSATANYLERSKEMNMPVLQVADLLSNEAENIESEENTADVVTEELPKRQKEPQIIELRPVEEISIISLGEPKTEEESAINQQIDNNSKSQAFRIVDKIMDETHKLWSSKRKIRSNILEVNQHSAYSFVGYMITTSDSGTVLNDIKGRITYKEVCHIIVCLLRQAKSAGLIDLTQYRALRREQSYILKKYSNSFFGEISKHDIEHINLVIEEMYQEMTKVVY